MQTLQRYHVTLLAIALGVVLTASLFSEPEEIAAQVATDITGYAWSDTIGWISMSGSGYGLSIDAEGFITGYAWSDNVGWISAEPADLAGCPQAPCEAYMNSTELAGWLKVISANGAQNGGWDGWISLSGAGYGPSLGGGIFSGYAWGSDVLGWVKFSHVASGAGNDEDDFNYNVATDYVPCVDVYQCVDLTHRDDACTPAVNENEYCGDGNACLAGGVCAQPVADGELTLSPALVPTGNTTEVTWDATDTSSCRVFSDATDDWYGGASGTETSDPIIATTLFTLECANVLGQATSTIDTAYAVVVPTWVER